MLWPRLVFPPINLYSLPKQEPSSPCVKRCKLEGNNCTGCKRTLQEIQDWSLLDRKQKILIIKQIKER